MNKRSVISVDDDPVFQKYLSCFLTDRGYEVETLADGDQLLARLSQGAIPSLVLLDLRMPEIDGLQVMEKLRAAKIQVPVIMLSGADFVRSVVEAMKLGASDFLTKPFEEDIFEATLEKILRGKVGEVAVSPSAQAGLRQSGFVTANSIVFRLSEIVRRVAHTDVPILILGESGVGKEVLARYAHAHSGRDTKPFVKVNCAALPDDLLESELFGYERGAFTGALTDKPGKFELAHEGRLLLDEVGEMSPHLQSKLLHVLQDGGFTRLGGTKPVRVDARIIATTNIRMAEGLATGKFRQDLYFRLNVISVELPPLRERREDIPALCDYFMEKYRVRYNAAGRKLPAEILNRFENYDWPGNIRQLENCIKQFLILPHHHSLLTEIVFDEIRVPNNTPPASDSNLRPSSLLDIGAGAADRAQRELVERVLDETRGNRKAAARRLNICYKSLLNKLKRWSAPDITMLPRSPVIQQTETHS